MNTKTFVNMSRVKAVATIADANPNMTGMPAGSTHWRVTLRSRGRQMTVPFSQGPAICKEPSAADVLDCLASDAASAEGRSFEEWASDMGYDGDSRRALKTFNAVERQTEKLRRFLGESGFQTLVFKTDRL